MFPATQLVRWITFHQDDFPPRDQCRTIRGKIVSFIKDTEIFLRYVNHSLNIKSCAKNAQDPIMALGRKVRSDIGKSIAFVLN